MSSNYIETLPSNEGSGAAWLGWKKMDKAASGFIDAANAAIEALEIFGFAEGIIKQLRDEEIPNVEDIQDQLEDCEDDILAAVTLIEDLYVEEGDGGSLSNFLSCFDDNFEELIFHIEDNASGKLAEDLVKFVESKLDPVRKARINLHFVIAKED